MSQETVLITGAARRLGAALTQHLAGHGYRVIVHYNRSAEAAATLVENVTGCGGDAICAQSAFSSEEKCTSFIETVTQQHGPIHHLINNASIFPDDTLDTATQQSVEENFAINTMVPLFLGRHLRKKGTLKTVTNMLDTRVLDYDQQHISYHLSKRGLQSLTAMMALEWAPSVRVNGVAPGLILPPEGKDVTYLEELAHTNPLQRVGEPDDICAAVQFLIQSPFVTGQTIYVDGGRHLKGRVYE